ncbi:Nitrogen fixation protein rnfB [Fusobacterium polymorphum]|uniref:NADH dehydrogenase (Ubiquinone), RnfB subunit n=1 Tax=Fusobacterium polymorphum ATCC 10953 TaxID=393480 RepID=A5TRQ1_FUSNP|nr:RnfABCDGE type electron transport complex subunit B [Fusobacterium polymorphum]EDK87576.1 NADH dehydrogenase (ubiquinone), RnfB subunit [Fusobacterium polymorphum ATCC 10953]UTI52884.1 RnfABCDGE type electron transport complex subunit B [Fusobacterium polymorphum]WRL67400.1 RnfABCDGE type electron transport complex subunit B [Fusobacterium polymorphum]CKH15662.1 Nitrogen fixation protein rnfB [Fusobacterium polymorphum]
MEAIMMPVAVLGITGVLMGLFLAYASKKFEVEVDPKVEAILAILPGVNCGACGYPGCSGYASGVALEGAKMTLCAPGGPKVAAKIGEIMGVEVEMPVKKKPATKKPEVKKEAPKAQTGEPISASQEFIEKNKRMLMKFKEAFDAGDKEGFEKLENLAKMAKKDELLKYYEEIKAGKIVPDGSAPVATGAANANAISASKEFVEKNKRMLMKFKEAFDAGDKEGFEKLENLAKMAKKDELLKYYEEIKAGKIVPDPATMGNVVAAVKVEAISAPKEFVEKNKRMLMKFKEAFDTGDKEGFEKLENLAKMAKKDELLKYYEEIKAGKTVPDPATMTDIPVAKEEAPKAEVKASDSQKQEASYCSILGDGLCVPEQNEKVKENLKKQAEPPKTAEELEREKQATSYCSVLGDGLCVPEENEQIVKQNLHQEIDKEIK